MDYIEAIDAQLFQWVNSHHNGVLDWILWILSQHWCWMIVLLAIFLFITIRHDRSNWIWVLTGMALCFLLADQISNNAIKDGVQRLRPCWEMDDVRMFRTSKGGMYGFVSSHAANAFAIAMFLSLMYGGKRKKTHGERTQRYQNPLLPHLLMGWAAIVGYSRIYLGKHYPGDVVCGALLGLGVGASVYFVISRISLRIKSKSSA